MMSVEASTGVAIWDGGMEVGVDGLRVAEGDGVMEGVGAIEAVRDGASTASEGRFGDGIAVQPAIQNARRMVMTSVFFI